MPTHQILCLANSDKHQGRCIAGLRQDGKGWIRPISTKNDGTLFSQDYQLSDDDEPLPLDIIEIDFLKPSPQPHHPENWLFNPQPWRLCHRFNRHSASEKQQIREFLETVAVSPPYLFNDFDKKIKYSYLLDNPTSASLILVKPENLNFKVIQLVDSWKLKASFTLQNCPYCLSVTDPIFKQKIQHLPDGNYPIHSLSLPDFNPDCVFFTISLSEPYEEYCYKLVAAVISI